MDKNIVRFCFFYQFLSSEQMYRDELRKLCTPNFSQSETQFPAVAERLRQLELWLAHVRVRTTLEFRRSAVRYLAPAGSVWWNWIMTVQRLSLYHSTYSKNPSTPPVMLFVVSDQQKLVLFLFEILPYCSRNYFVLRAVEIWIHCVGPVSWQGHTYDHCWDEPYRKIYIKEHIGYTSSLESLPRLWVLSLPLREAETAHPFWHVDWVLVKDLRRRRWHSLHWRGPNQVLLNTPTELKVSSTDRTRLTGRILYGRTERLAAPEPMKTGDTNEQNENVYLHLVEKPLKLGETINVLLCEYSQQHWGQYIQKTFDNQCPNK